MLLLFKIILKGKKIRVQIWLLELEGASEGLTVNSVWLVREMDGS